MPVNLKLTEIHSDDQPSIVGRCFPEFVSQQQLSEATLDRRAPPRVGSKASIVDARSEQHSPYSTVASNAWGRVPP
jgi:hypothetical protein